MGLCRAIDDRVVSVARQSPKSKIVRADVLYGMADQLILREALAGIENVFRHAVSGVGTVLGDVSPDGSDIRARFACEVVDQHYSGFVSAFRISRSIALAWSGLTNSPRSA